MTMFFLILQITLILLDWLPIMPYLFPKQLCFLPSSSAIEPVEKFSKQTVQLCTSIIITFYDNGTQSVLLYYFDPSMMVMLPFVPKLKQFARKFSKSLTNWSSLVNLMRGHVVEQTLHQSQKSKRSNSIWFHFIYRVEIMSHHTISQGSCEYQRRSCMWKLFEKIWNKTNV